MGRIIIIIAALVGSSAANASSTNLSSTLSKILCSKKIAAKLDARVKKQTWAPVNISQPEKPLLSGIEFRDTRTMEAYKIYSMGSESFLEKTNLKTNEVETSAFDSKKACAVTTKTEVAKALPVPVQAGFDDSKLSKLMSENNKGLIYVWSPHMPLSVEALAEIKKVSAQKKLPLTVLLDAEAQMKDAKKWQDLGKVSEGEMTRVASQELYARNVRNHYPVLFVYQDKFLSNRRFVGHKPADRYVELIDGEFSELKKDLK